VPEFSADQYYPVAFPGKRTANALHTLIVGEIVSYSKKKYRQTFFGKDIR
jgi:hypothetical protein